MFITDRGRPAHVLLTIDEYRRLAQDGRPRNLSEALAQPAGTDGGFEFEFERSRDMGREIDFGPE